MQTLPQRISAANTLLAPYAVPTEGTLGRVIAEKPDETRFPFQRDRDRIIHSLAFRRLKGKTQVFVAGVGDHYRTRLTHTMEVAQISRDIARTLGLNEDLAESIALAHDLGHPPFGHAGEEALDSWMHTFGSRFEHNEQSLRIVTALESHSSLHLGLNLNIEILEGLMKHRTPHDEPRMKIERNPSLEAQIVNIADEIAYTGHDCDDGLRAGLFSTESVTRCGLPKHAKQLCDERGTSLRSGIIHLLISDLYAETERRIAALSIRTFADVYACKETLVAFSEPMRTSLTELRTFLWNNMYLHPSVQERTDAGQIIVMRLCEALKTSPNDKVLTLMRTHDCTLQEAVKDYVAGMTDAFAEAQAAEL